MKKFFAALLALMLVFTLCACGGKDSPATGEGTKTYKVGICNYVDDASLNQIVKNIQDQLTTLGQKNNVTFDVKVENCNADPNVMNQIIANFIADNVDLMVGVATPVAMAMQAATEDNQIPVVFSAVSDPVGADLVASLEKPGANITGTSDFLNTDAIMELIFATNPDVETVGLLYDLGQDSSTAPIKAAKEFLSKKGVEVVEATGTNTSEIVLAAQTLIADEVDAIFTPTDNTVMTAELSIYEALAEAGIPHFCGADSFALNGAFLGYGVDYANLGVETANMIADILLNGKAPGTVPAMTFDNGIATVNTETAEALGLDYEELTDAFAQYCTKVQPITTAEEFDS